MSKIESLMANRDAVVAFIGEFNNENGKPCPSKVITEKFVTIDIKKLLPLLKEDGVLASEKGRYGGYMTLDFANVHAANKAEKKATKPTKAKAAKSEDGEIKVAAKRTTKKKVEKVVPAGPTDVAGNSTDVEAVSAEEAQAGLAAVREIVKNYKKKPEPVVEADDETDEDDVKPLSFDDVGPSSDDLEEIDEEYQTLLNDMNDIVSYNTFSEA